MKKRLTAHAGRVVALGVAVLVCWLIANQADATPGKKTKNAGLKGIVTDSQGRPVVGATVYLVDSTLVNTSQITPAGVLASTTDGFDEPLEDIIRNADVAKTLPQAITNTKGQFSVKKLNGELKYFPFVVPDAAKDTDHLPGGDVSRAAFSPKGLVKGGLKIKLSWNAPADATYIGSTACYGCHPEQANNKKHAHSLALRVPGQLTGNQDLGFHLTGNQFTDKFIEGTDYKTATDSTKKINVLYWMDWLSSASNFIVREGTTSTVPTGAMSSKVYLKAYLWKKATGEHYITLENPSAGAADTNSPLHLQLAIMKGGLMGKMYMLVKLPASANRKGLYRFIGWKGYTGSSEGKLSFYDRSKHPYDNTLGDWLKKGTDNTFGTADDRLGWPTAKTTTGGYNNFDASCGRCHFTGFGIVEDAGTGEALANLVADSNGHDLYGTGTKGETMIGCEVCHGKGSKHRDEALKQPATTTTPASTTKTPRTPRTKTENFKGKYIINPKLLCNDRSSLICGRCHRASDGQLDNNSLPPPGISRAEYLASYVDPTKRGPAITSYWPDLIHPKSGKNYPDWLSAKHSHNQRYLVGCDDCHSGHFSDGESPRSLLYNPEHADSPLCQRCHSKDVAEHAREMTGNAMTGATTECIHCHMPKTALEGAGKPGLILGTPDGKVDGTSTDANIIYWEGDVPSHVFDVPTKYTIGVAGVKPGSAMPVPYNYSCGICHDSSKLQYQGPK
jgi:hypothetical protein